MPKLSQAFREHEDTLIFLADVSPLVLSIAVMPGYECGGTHVRNGITRFAN